MSKGAGTVEEEACKSARMFVQRCTQSLPSPDHTGTPVKCLPSIPTLVRGTLGHLDPSFSCSELLYVCQWPQARGDWNSMGVESALTFDSNYCLLRNLWKMSSSL